MKQLSLWIGAAFLLLAGEAGANERYREPPPLTIDPALAAPWVMQLRRGLNTEQGSGRANALRTLPAPERQSVERARPRRQLQAAPREDAAMAEPPRGDAGEASVQTPTSQQRIRARFLPQTVPYEGSHEPGTIVIDTAARLLYLVQPGGTARRYGVGVGKQGFSWKGTQTITNKREWPDWRPPAEMIAREKRKGRTLPARMAGGPENPLGARALYLGDTLYRIHGTNAPWSIGQAVSSGCIRMRNEDVIELYENVEIGATVVVG